MSGTGVRSLLTSIVACFVVLAPTGTRRVEAQATGVLEITVALGPDQSPTPIRRHALLISDTPPSRAPWRVLTGVDGRGRVTLPPGTYTVESEEALVAQGRTFEWRQVVEVTAGQTTQMRLLESSAEVGDAPARAESTAAGPADAWDLLMQHEKSVLGAWAPARLASTILIDSTGLLVTTAAGLGSATEIPVQVTADARVRARGVAVDATREVAVLRVAPETVASRPPLPIACDPAPAPVARGAAIAALAVGRRGPVHVAAGRVAALDRARLTVDYDYPVETAGGPVMSGDGTLVGIASPVTMGTDEDPRATVVTLASVCEVLAATRAAAQAPPPSAEPLPSEPGPSIDEEALQAEATRRAGSLSPIAVSGGSFEIALVTPVVAFAGLQGAMDFGDWTPYVADRHPVLLVRATPRQTEPFWIKVARGAAMTQGMMLPPIKRFKPGVARARVLCGTREVRPVLPLVVERRTSPTDSVREGLLVLTPDAIGPHCGRVAIEVSSEKSPDTWETAVVDPRTVEQVWRELAPYRVTRQ